MELHGCLPSSMRGNAEQQRKYSLDLQKSPRSPLSSSSSTTPPGVAPKPRRPSVENRRDAFAKNRSLTNPALPTSPSSVLSSPSAGSVFGDSSSYSFSTSSPSNKSRTSSVCSSASYQDVIVEESSSGGGMYSRWHNMWRKSKKSLKMPPPLYKCCKIKRMTIEFLRTIQLHINIDKGGRGEFSVFLTFCHTIMSMIVDIVKYQS